MMGLWFEVAAVMKKDDAEVKDIEGSDVLIRGNVDNMMVIQVPKGVDHTSILVGVQRMLEKEGIDKGVFVIDQDIEMMKLVPVERKKARVMEAKHQAAKAARKAMAQAPEPNAPGTRTKH